MRSTGSSRNTKDVKEAIHHLDGDPRNNEISNLEVVAVGETTRIPVYIIEFRAGSVWVPTSKPYFPVDLNSGLLERALKRMKSRGSNEYRISKYVREVQP